MVALSWQGINGAIVGQKYSLEKLLMASGDQATFAGTLLPTGDRITVTCFPASEERYCWPGYAFNLRHPRLRAVLGTGEDLIEGCLVRYVVLEPVDALLSDCLVDEGPLTTTLARKFMQDLVAGLHYLHHNNLVYFNLRPATIARVDQNWQLADLALLRRAGLVDPAESRRFLTLSPQTPPDAYTGLVSPAWDIYSLGVTLNQCMLGEEGMRSGRTQRLPAPFDMIVRGCLAPEPDDRISLDEIAYVVGMDLGRGGQSRQAMAS